MPSFELYDLYTPAVEELINMRQSLPAYTSPRPKTSLWSIIKSCIGRDLTRISLPVILNEPLSLLQRTAEDIEYSYLLDAAAKTSDAYERAMLVAVFAVSFYNSFDQRHDKPFNPLLHETYELELPERNVRFVAEQVSHHPPVTASYAEGRGWRYNASIGFQVFFRGNSLEVKPSGLSRVVFCDNNGSVQDTFTWKKVTTCTRNLIFGGMWLEHYGQMRIVNESNPDVIAFATLHRRQKIGRRDFEHAKVTGMVTDAKGRAMRRFAGHHNKAIYEELDSDVKGSMRQRRLLWQRNSLPDDARAQAYHMTKFAVGLNDSPTETLPRTDSRWRPDVRALENGDFALAAKEKARLEAKQRSGAAARSFFDKPLALWFEKQESKDGAFGMDYAFKGTYFTSKSQGFKGVNLPEVY